MSSIQEKLSQVRSEAGLFFYAASATVEKDVAEKMAIDMYRLHLNEQINLHERFIKICDELIEDVEGKKKKNKVHPDYFIAQEARKDTHKREITKLKEQIELIPFL